MITIVDFYSPTCKPCEALVPILDKVVADNDNIKLTKVDVTLDRDMAIEYKIRSVPTLLFIKDAVILAQSNGLQTEDQIKEILGRIGDGK